MPLHASRIVNSEAETRLIGLALGRVLRGGDTVLLEGSLGAGKTTLVRSIAEGLGLDTGAVASPTFVIVHEYTRPAPTAERPCLIHVDAYRLSGPEELDSLGWDAVVARVRGPAAAACLVVEWPQRVGRTVYAGADPATIRIEHGGGAGGDEARELLLTIPDEWNGRPGLPELLARKATTCPITGEPVPADSPTYPFASERARMADLHRWFSGGYQITREVREADLEEE